MLARTWSGTEATAIWVELVACRKKDIQENQDASQIQGMAAMVAAQQDISRADLAKWDSSARAWLLCADEVQDFKQTQLRLITENCGLHVSSLGNTYSSVVEVWTVAMKTIQDLLLGMPQRITKGAVLVGLSAWHVYPDLNIVGPIAHVRFSDKLVGAGGVITIGLQSVSREEHTGVQWSLSLSHLRYYGDPVSLSATAGDASLRVTMRDLHYVALGSLFAAWVPYVSDNSSGCEFLLALRDAVKDSKKLDLVWLQLLWDASQQFLGPSEPLERDNASFLMALGRRRGQIFFGWEKDSPIPLLGLNSPVLCDWFSWTALPHVDDVFEYTMSCIKFFRAKAEQYDLGSDQYLIRYCGYHGREFYQGRPSRDSNFWPRRDWYHYTTARPIRVPGLKRDWYGNRRAEHEHFHWLSLSCPYSSLDERIRQLDEHMLQLDAEADISFPNFGNGHGHRFQWSRPHKSFLRSTDVVDDRHGSFHYSNCAADTADGSYQRSLPDSLHFEIVAGLEEEIALFRVLENQSESSSKKAFIKDTQATSFLRSGKAKSEKLEEYLWTQQRVGANVQPYPEMPTTHPMDSISSLAQATALYDQLQGATVSISVLNVSLRDAGWRMSYHRRRQEIGKRMSQCERFACIAMFESGKIDLNPDSFVNAMAMSSGNSIFALSALLQDPSVAASSSGEITRILGNLNRPGIVVLVPPIAPLIRKCNPSAWRVIAHTPFDGKPIDSFPHTSLHLSFTQYDMPLIIRTGTVDTEVTVVESLVSVYDRQKWTGDIDVVNHNSNPIFNDRFGAIYVYGVYTPMSACRHAPSSSTLSSAAFIMRLGTAHCRQLISIDSWDELLDPPGNLGSQTIGVLRAAGNWQAKLAAFTVCMQLGYRTFLKPAHWCDECLLKIGPLKHIQIYIL